MTITAYDHAYTYDNVRAGQQIMTGVILHSTCEELATSSDIIMSVVAADEAVNATTSIAPFLSRNHLFLDGNSVSPGTKSRSADILKSYNAGVTYLDMAIMAPIHPLGHRSALLIAGPGRERVTPFLDHYGFEYDWEGAEPGQASIIKMLRSVLIKGSSHLFVNQ